jgi:hypothetical protein
MDVHPPHHPILNVKEFLIHMLAITLGLLIALALEGWVEWLHHRHLVRDARENIAAEMATNQQDVARQLSALPAEEKHLDDLSSLVDDVQHGSAPKPLGDFNWTSALLRDSAWNAANSTGAIAFMNYDEVKQYSELYAVQRLHASILDRSFKDRHEMNVLLARVEGADKLSDGEYEECKRIIQSAKLTDMEFKEFDNLLNGMYSKLQAQER